MNLVDQTIALFSPRAALRREVARQKLTAFSRFDAAKVTRNRPMARMNMPAEQLGGTFGHVFEEEVVHLLLVHVSQLETEGGVRTGGRENLFRHLGFGFRRKDRKQDEMKNFG